jgi:hypothetical protein
MARAPIPKRASDEGSGTAGAGRGGRNGHRGGIEAQKRELVILAVDLSRRLESESGDRDCRIEDDHVLAVVTGAGQGGVERLPVLPGSVVDPVGAGLVVAILVEEVRDVDGRELGRAAEEDLQPLCLFDLAILIAVRDPDSVSGVPTKLGSARPGGEGDIDAVLAGGVGRLVVCSSLGKLCTGRFAAGQGFENGRIAWPRRTEACRSVRGALRIDHRAHVSPGGISR